MTFLSKKSTVFGSFSLAMSQLLSHQFTQFYNFVHVIHSDLFIFLPTVFSDSYKVGIDTVLAPSCFIILPWKCLDLSGNWPVLKPPSNDAFSPFHGTLKDWQNSVVKEADLLISLAETWLLLVTSPCATLKKLPLHPGITSMLRWWLFCIMSNSFPVILCYHFPDLCEFVAFLWIPVLSTICFVVLLVWCLITAARSWLHFSGRRGNTGNCELKLCIMLLEMRISKGVFAMHTISTKTSLQMCICAGIVEIGITLCREKEEMTDSRDLQSILIFHNCASVCRTAMKLSKSLH